MEPSKNKSYSDPMSKGVVVGKSVINELLQQIFTA